MKIPADSIFTDKGYILRKGKTVELPMNLYSLVEKYNNSKKGMYRIIKSPSYYDDDPYALYAEFEIK